MMVSRIQSTQALYELFESRTQKPKVLFNASAMGYYPPDLYYSYTELYQTLPLIFYQILFTNGNVSLINLKISEHE